MSLTARLNAYSPYILSLVRIITALLLLEHGMTKLLGWPLSEMHPPAMSLPWIAGIFELVCGVLLTVGLFTRLAAFFGSGLCAFAYFLAHAPHNFFPMNNGGDAAILFCFIFLYFVFAGAGPLSIDATRAKA